MGSTPIRTAKTNIMKINIRDREVEMIELVIGDGVTLCYKESISGNGFWGFVKEVPGAITQGETIEELIEMAFKAKKSIEFVENEDKIKWNTK